MLPTLPSPRVLGALQRVLLVALLAPVLIIASLAAVPALMVLPFLPDGTPRAVQLLTAHAATARTLLAWSRHNGPR
ncbi:dTMP kinase [Kitasatospora sp. NPDC101235]|uniref:dTMP kinase n=1 Tax=Kitasatospora sp. NPDC101235 TaxID=3364101 RepID=UPI0037F39221